MEPLKTFQTGATQGVAFLGGRKLGCCGYDELAVKPAMTQPIRNSKRLRAGAPQTSKSFPVQNLEQTTAGEQDSLLFLP